MIVPETGLSDTNLCALYNYIVRLELLGAKLQLYKLTI